MISYRKEKQAGRFFVVVSLLKSLLPKSNQTCMFCSFFILLSRESDGSAIFWTNPYPFKSCPFLSFLVVSLTSYH